ncbi:MAG: ABC transporter ATP-binding protein [Gammaproteobacteria bacterium]|nr:ABC transporter ATP-binding protein [Gammaproteobacteria bacterium]
MAVRGLGVSYGTQRVLEAIDLEVFPGEVVVLLGRSGSGKSTLLRAIAGFVTAESGSIVLGGRDLTRAPPHARGLGLVVQNYALFPHMRVEENVAFGLRARRRSRADTMAAVTRFLDLVGMGAYRQRYPRELSGGQQQRVALARALAIEPDALLLDEPLSALDAPLRAEMIEELRRLHERLPDIAVVHVTHDQSEAMALADRIVLLHEGRIVAQGSPRALYDRPPNARTARFFGQANLLPVTILQGAERPAHTDAGGSAWSPVCIAGQTLLAATTTSSPTNGRALLCVRASEFRLARPSGAAGDGSDGGARMNVLQGRVRSVHWLGATQRLLVDLGEATIRAELPERTTVPRPGETIALEFAPEGAVLLAEE